MPFGTFKQQMDEQFGKFKTEAIETFTDPVKVGCIIVNAASSAAISYGVEKFLLKGIEWKYKWLGYKTTKIPVINVKVPYPAMVDKKLVLVPKMAGKPINELKRNLVAGAVGTVVSGLWTVPVYLKVDKGIGKAMAIGSGLNMLGWIIKGGVQYAKATVDYKEKVKQKPVVKKAAKKKKGKSEVETDSTYFQGATYYAPTPQSPYPASSVRNPTDVIWEQFAQPEDSPGMQQDYVWAPGEKPYEGQVPYYDEPMYLDPIDYQPIEGEEVGKKHHGGGGRGRGWGPYPYYPEPIYVETEEAEQPTKVVEKVIIVEQKPWWAEGLGEESQGWLNNGDTDGEGADGVITYNGAKKKKGKKGKKDFDARIEKLDEQESEMLEDDMDMDIAATYNW
jgi:hypothetical protein